MTDLEPIAPQLAFPPLLELVAREKWAPPKRLEISPQASTKINHCYVNVLRQIDNFGGSGVYCWKILEFPKLFLQAIHHAVWKGRDGRMVDVTPDIRNWRKMIVAPDHSRVFSGVPAQTVLPKFLNFSGLAEVDEMIDVSSRLTSMQIGIALPNGLLPQLDGQDTTVVNLQSRARLLLSLASVKAAVK